MMMQASSHLISQKILQRSVHLHYKYTTPRDIVEKYSAAKKLCYCYATFEHCSCVIRVLRFKNQVWSQIFMYSVQRFTLRVYCDRASKMSWQVQSFQVLLLFCSLCSTHERDILVKI